MDNLLTVYKGDDVSQLFALRLNGLPVDLTGVTTMTCTLQNDPSQSSATVTLGIGTGITLTAGDLGKFTLAISAAQSAVLLAVVQAHLDFVVTSTGSKKQTYRVQNGLSVLARNP